MHQTKVTFKPINLWGSVIDKVRRVLRVSLLAMIRYHCEIIIIEKI